MTSLHIVELEAVINRCRAAMLPTPLVLAHFNSLATLYGTMIYERRQFVALDDLAEHTRHAALAYMAPVVSSTASVVAAAGPSGGGTAAPADGCVETASVAIAARCTAEELGTADSAVSQVSAVTAGTA